MSCSVLYTAANALTAEKLHIFVHVWGSDVENNIDVVYMQLCMADPYSHVEKWVSSTLSASYFLTESKVSGYSRVFFSFHTIPCLSCWRILFVLPFLMFVQYVPLTTSCPCHNKILVNFFDNTGTEETLECLLCFIVLCLCNDVSVHV
jgi:hypothetical protein